jgi:hypothetical protein
MFLPALKVPDCDRSVCTTGQEIAAFEAVYRYAIGASMVRDGCYILVLRLWKVILLTLTGWRSPLKARVRRIESMK